MSNSNEANEQFYAIDIKPYVPKAWSGNRFLDFFQVDPKRLIATEVWLSHTKNRELAETDHYVIIGTFSPRRSFSDLGKEGDVAFEAAIRLASGSLPDANVPRPAGFGRRLADYVTNQVRARESWPAIEIQIDGQMRACKYWKFAGGIAAFCGVNGPIPVAIQTKGVDLAQLSLESRADISDYGVNLDRGIRRTDIITHTTSPTDYHPDYAFLL